MEIDSASHSWPVTRDGEPYELGLRDDGLTLSPAPGQGETLYRWAEVQDAEFPTSFSFQFTSRGETVALGFHAGAIQRDFRQALEAHDVAVRTPPPAAVVPEATGSARGPLKEDYLWVFFIIALLLGGLGFAFVVTQDGSVDCDAYGVCSDGKATVVFGYLLMGVANLLALISIIGWGVKLGLRAALADGTLRRP